MAPKIRGISPTFRRHSKPDLGVSVKKISKQDRSSKNPSLQKGDIVDVRLEEEGLFGSWHPAVICGVKQGSRQVKFQSLLDDKNNPVKEWVSFGKDNLTVKLPGGARKQIYKSLIRPGGPGLPPPKPSFRKTGGWPKDLWVECYSEEAWWEGVLLQDISAAQINDGDSVVDVIFPQLGDLVEQVSVKNLRECKDWDEDTNVWTIRGRRTDDDSAAPEPVSLVLEQVDAKEFADGGSNLEYDSKLQEVEECKEETSLREISNSGSQASLMPPSVGPDRQFGRLTEVVEKENCFLLMLDTLGYKLEEIRFSIKDGFLLLDTGYDELEDKRNSFICQLSSVSTCKLCFPRNLVINHEKVSWEVTNEGLTVTVTKGCGDARD